MHIPLLTIRRFYTHPLAFLTFDNQWSIFTEDSYRRVAQARAATQVDVSCSLHTGSSCLPLCRSGTVNDRQNKGHTNEQDGRCPAHEIHVSYVTRSGLDLEIRRIAPA